MKYIKKNKHNENVISLEEKIYDEIRLEDTIEDYDNLIIDKIIINETNDELYRILNNELSEIEKKIIKMSYGIGCREYKQKEMAKILHIPQYKISRIKNRLLKRIKICINHLN